MTFHHTQTFCPYSSTSLSTKQSILSNTGYFLHLNNSDPELSAVHTFCPFLIFSSSSSLLIPPPRSFLHASHTSCPFSRSIFARKGAGSWCALGSVAIISSSFNNPSRIASSATNFKSSLLPAHVDKEERESENQSRVSFYLHLSQLLHSSMPSQICDTHTQERCPEMLDFLVSTTHRACAGAPRVHTVYICRMSCSRSHTHITATSGVRSSLCFLSCLNCSRMTDRSSGIRASALQNGSKPAAAVPHRTKSSPPQSSLERMPTRRMSHSSILKPIARIITCGFNYIHTFTNTHAHTHTHTYTHSHA